MISNVHNPYGHAADYPGKILYIRETTAKKLLKMSSGFDRRPHDRCYL